MAKKKVVMRRFLELMGEDKRSDRNLVYTIEGDSDVVQEVQRNWGYDESVIQKTKYLRLSFTNPSKAVLDEHKGDITDILKSNNKALLLSKKKDETIAFWCKFRLQAAAKFDLEFIDNIDEEPLQKPDIEVVIGKEGNFKTDESIR